MTQKSIRIIIGTLQVGGTEKHLSYVLPGLVEKGWSVKVITTTSIVPLSETFTGKGILVFPAPKWVDNAFWSNPLLRPFRLMYGLFRLMHEFIKDRQSITHFYLPRTYGLGMVAAMLTCLKAPKIMSRRSLNEYQKKYPGFKIFETFLHKRCDRILGNSGAVVKQLHTEEKVPQEKIKLIYNGIPLLAQINFNRQEVRKRLKISETDRVMILVANLIPYKGHGDLIQALGQIKSRLPQSWKLLCVGGGESYLSELERQANSQGVADHILWLGKRHDVSALLCASDVGLLCSHEEGFSNSILEGMAESLPMIVTDVGGNKEAVIHGTTGLVVKPRDPSALGEAILRLLSDPELCQKMGAEGRKRIEENFSLEKCVESYHDLYKSFLR